MRFEGKIWKDGRFWLVEIPAFDAMTQGRTREEAFRMAADLLETMCDESGTKIEVQREAHRGSDTFWVSSPQLGRLVSLMLRRQRQKHGLTLAEVSARLGQASRNAYARYEQGRARPTVEKLEELLRAISPDQHLTLQLSD